MVRVSCKMFEKLRDVLSEKGKEIGERMDATIEQKKEEAKSELDAYFKDLEQASKIVLPVNLLEIVAKGGYVLACEYDTLSSNSQNTTKSHHLSVEITRVDSYQRSSGKPVISNDILLENGCQYRVVVLVEKREKAQIVAQGSNKGGIKK